MSTPEIGQSNERELKFINYKRQVEALLTQGGILFKDGEIITHMQSAEGQYFHIFDHGAFESYTSRITPLRMSLLKSSEMQAAQSGERKRGVQTEFTLIKSSLLDEEVALPTYGVEKWREATSRRVYDEFDFVPSDFIINLQKYVAFPKEDLDAFGKLLEDLEEHLVKRSPSRGFDFERFLSEIANKW